MMQIGLSTYYLRGINFHESSSWKIIVKINSSRKLMYLRYSISFYRMLWKGVNWTSTFIPPVQSKFSSETKDTSKEHCQC